MNMAETNETWSAKKSKLKLKFTTLTDSDLLFVKGKREGVIAKLQIILGKTKEELEEILKTL